MASGHLGWAFAGPGTFHARTSAFLAEGARRGERLMFVADDPNPKQWPTPLLERGVLQVASTREVYGPDYVVDAVTQRATFAAVLAQALEDGYSGLRVAADNSSLVGDRERLELWRTWESVADDFIADNPVTGLCAFDRERVTGAVLDQLMRVHRQHFSRRGQAHESSSRPSTS